MKITEMTNEELATWLDGAVASCLFRGSNDYLREAASRLRNATVREMAHRAAVEAYRREVKDLNSKRQATICDLRRRLKVAEDALEYAKGSITRDCIIDCDHFQECGDFKVCLCEQRINNALAAIRGEGGHDEQH